MLSTIRNGYSALGENFRYLSYKYDLSPTSWIYSLCKDISIAFVNRVPLQYEINIIIHGWDWCSDTTIIMVPKVCFS